MTSFAPLSVVFGCAGPVLGDEEAAFFRDTNLFGLYFYLPEIVKTRINQTPN